MPNPVTADSFKRIVLKDASDNIINIIGADSTTDSLTLKVGIGMSISANETNDTVNIGIVSTVNTAALNDILYNGNTSTFGITVADVNVDDIKINLNKIQVDHATNNLTLETTGAGSVVVNDNFQILGTTTSQHILPSADVTYDLGSSSYRFRDLYLSGSSIKLGSATITAVGSGVNLPAGSQLGGVDLGTATLPDQSGNSGKFLSTNGTTPYWGSPAAFNGGTITSALIVNNNLTVGSTYSLTVDKITYKTSELALGLDAGLSQGLYSTAIGWLAGNATQGSNSIAVGNSAGKTGQGDYALSIGFSAGLTSQGANAIALGKEAGKTSQAIESIAVGLNAGSISQLSYSVAIGSGAGQTNQGTTSVALGKNSGSTSQGDYSISIGEAAGNDNQGDGAIAIGSGAGNLNQADSSISLGSDAGNNSQGNSAIAIGTAAGQTTQDQRAIAIGQLAGQRYQSVDTVSIGSSAGQFEQYPSAIAIGPVSGYDTQGSYSIALGAYSGHYGQKSNSISIGYNAGKAGQGTNSIAIGNSAGASSVNTAPITSVGSNGQNFVVSSGQNIRVGDVVVITGSFSGSGSITGWTTGDAYRISSVTGTAPNITTFNLVNLDGSALTTVSGTFSSLTAAFLQAQQDNSIIIQADGALGVGVGVDAQSNAFYVSPIRSASTTNFLYYDNTTKEITYSSSVDPSVFGSTIRLGVGAGQTGWVGDVAIGYQTQNTGSNNFSQAIGYQAGQTSQAASAVALGYQAGNSSQGQQSIAIGRSAGKTSQSANSIAIGGNAVGSGAQGQYSVAIGDGSSLYGQGSYSISIGRASGTIPQSGNGVIIGAQSHNATTQGSNSVSIGYGTGAVVYGSFTNVSITGIAGQLSLDATVISPGTPIFINGTNTGSGSIQGYVSGTYYKVLSVTSPTSLVLGNIDGSAIVTSVGTLVGFSYLVDLGLGDNVVSISATGSDSTAVRQQNTSTFIRPIRQFDSPNFYSALVTIQVFSGGIFTASGNAGLVVGNRVVMLGAVVGTGAISGYVPANQNIYYIIAVNQDKSIFQLSSSVGGSAITTTPGTFSVTSYVIYNQPTADTLPLLKYNASTGEVVYVNHEDSINLRMKYGLNGTSLTANRPTDQSVTSIFNRTIRGTPSVISGFGGNEIMLGSQMGSQRWSYYAPVGPNLSTFFFQGLSNTGVVTTGTATARVPATTNAVTRSVRVGFASAATAASVATVNFATNNAVFTMGNGTGLGGFHLIWKFAITDAAVPVSGARFFAGLTSNTSSRTNAEPTTFTNSIGIAQLSTDATQLYIVHAGSATNNSIALGTNFPCVPSIGGGSDVYEFHLMSVSTFSDNLYYYIKRTGPTGLVFQAQGNIQNTGNTLPTSSTLLTPEIWRCNNATASAVSFDIISLNIETEN